MAEPAGPATESVPFIQHWRGATANDRVSTVVAAIVLVDTFLPWTGPGLFTDGVIGLSSGFLAWLALASGIAAGALVLGRLVGAIDLGPNDAMVALALGGGCLGFSLLWLLTHLTFATTGAYVAIGSGAMLTYIGLSRVRGTPGLDSVLPSRPGDAAGTRPAVSRPSTPLTSDVLLARLRGAISIGPIVGSLAAGALTFPAAHSVVTAVATAVGMMALLTGLRLLDGPLRPLWVLLGHIPLPVRFVAGIGIPLYISISRVQPAAGGAEIESMRTALFLSVFIAYVFLHGPPREEAAGINHG